MFLSSFPNESPIVEVRIWSDSDVPKIQPLLDQLHSSDTPHLLRVQSAHRMPKDMVASAEAFPEVLTSHYLPRDTQALLVQKQLQVALCIAAAGGSAHIAGMTASETQTPIIAYPVPSSSSHQFDSGFSMINMPPGIPNGVQFELNRIATLTKIIMDLRDNGNIPGIFIPWEFTDHPLYHNIIEHLPDSAMSSSDSANVAIATIDVASSDSVISSDNKQVSVIIPTLANPLNEGNIGHIFGNIKKLPGLSMGLQLQNNINPTNALLYFAQLICTIAPDKTVTLLEFLKQYRAELTMTAREKDVWFLKEQL